MVEIALHRRSCTDAALLAGHPPQLEESRTYSRKRGFLDWLLLAALLHRGRAKLQVKFPKNLRLARPHRARELHQQQPILWRAYTAQWYSARLLVLSRPSPWA